MKFLIIGSTDEGAIEHSYVRLLREKGCEVALWDNKQPSAFFGWKSWWEMDRATRAAYDTIKSWEFYRECCRYMPDVLFMPKAENVHSYAVKCALEKTGARLVVWYPDNPFKADQTSINILRDLKRSDLFYIWGKFLIEPLRAAGCRRVGYLPFGFDPSAHPGVEPTPQERTRYGCDICFVGTWDGERERALEQLGSFDLGIWGPYWAEKVSAASPLAKCVRGSALYGSEMVKAFKSAKVVFNHLRPHNGSAHNMRAMEIAGVGGGVQLVRRTPELASELFCDKYEIFCFDGNSELQSVLKSLTSDPNANVGVSRSAVRRVNADHLLTYRIGTILADLQE